MLNDVSFSFLHAFPRSPFGLKGRPNMNISGFLSKLAQVAQARHRQNTLHLCHFSTNIISIFTHGTGGTGKNQHIAHAHTRAHAHVKFLTSIWIIIKNTCSTCDKSVIIEDSPVPTACATLCHLCQERG